MGADTRIEWADHTFNPWTGCQAVSPACDHCYAEAQAKRAPKIFGGWGPHAERKRTSESYWRQPLKWNSEARKAGTRPRVFCASMADVFDNQVPIEWLIDLLDLIRTTEHLTWLLLTKRPQMIRRRLEEALAHLAQGVDRGDLIEWIALWLDGHPPPNVWLGTTVENQAEADRRIPHLLAVPAAKRFLSCEPLLGPVDLSPRPMIDPAGRHMTEDDVLRGIGMRHAAPPGYVFINGGPRINWIIAGGESGSKARPSHPDWFRSLRDQCQAAGVPFFFKQWGEWIGVPDLRRLPGGSGPGFGAFDHCRHSQDHEAVRVGKKAAGATLDGREWREVPA